MCTSKATPVHVLLIGVGAFLCLAPGPALSAAEAKVDPGGFTSARVCGECHSDIYESWKNSLHAFSLTDPIFDTAYMQAVKEGGEEARRVCLRCHAPMTMVNGDYELREGVTREGVSCDFCHSVTVVHLDGREKPYTVELGLVKRSVLKKASSPAHDVAYSELHGTSEFCGGCHNYVTARGKAVMSTYDEWKNGPYAGEGVQCQDCHMVITSGKVVREEIKETGAKIHLHNLIHDTDQLRSALSVQIANAERTQNRLQVDVAIENVGSGHMVPTGIPSREIVLSVSVDSGSRVLTQDRRYRKVVADEKGRVLKRDFEVLLYGARILNDNRIGPREKRLEHFDFDVPKAGRSAKVTVRLSYQYAPVILHEEQMDVLLGSVERIVY
jgi:hypothetical protein